MTVLVISKPADSPAAQERVWAMQLDYDNTVIIQTNIQQRLGDYYGGGEIVLGTVPIDPSFEPLSDAIPLRILSDLLIATSTAPRNIFGDAEEDELPTSLEKLLTRVLQEGIRIGRESAKK